LACFLSGDEAFELWENWAKQGEDFDLKQSEITNEIHLVISDCLDLGVSFGFYS
jgi:hypothetical protein